MKHFFSELLGDVARLAGSRELKFLLGAVLWPICRANPCRLYVTGVSCSPVSTYLLCNWLVALLLSPTYFIEKLVALQFSTYLVCLQNRCG